MRASLLCCLVLFCIACSSVQRASVGPVVAPPKGSNTLGTKLDIDPARSVVEVAGADRVTGEHIAIIQSTEVWVLAPTPNEISELSVAADLASLSMDNDDIEAFVKSEDFLDIARFPIAHFRSTRIEALGDARHRIRGVLALHGVSREIEFIANVSQTRSELAVDANFRLPRKAFGIERKDGWDFLISSEFRVRVKIIARQRPRPRAASRLSDRSSHRIR